MPVGPPADGASVVGGRTKPSHASINEAHWMAPTVGPPAKTRGRGPLLMTGAIGRWFAYSADHRHQSARRASGAETCCANGVAVWSPEGPRYGFLKARAQIWGGDDRSMDLVGLRRRLGIAAPISVPGAAEPIRSAHLDLEGWTAAKLIGRRRVAGPNLPLPRFLAGGSPRGTLGRLAVTSSARPLRAEWRLPSTKGATEVVRVDLFGPREECSGVATAPTSTSRSARRVCRNCAQARDPRRVGRCRA